MRILITSDWNMCAINGVATSIKNLMYSLRARGHEVKLLCLSSDHKTRITEDGWEVASLPANVVYPGARVRAGLMNRVYDKVIEWGPDIVHSQCEMSTFIMAHHIAHECDVPIVHTYHTVYEDYTHYVVTGKHLPAGEQRILLAKKVVAEFSKLVSGFCCGMIAPTEKVKELLEGYECKCPLYVVPSGIALEKFRQKLSLDERNEMRQKYGIAEDEIIALYLGRVAKEKNIDEVMKYIADRPEKIKLLVVGGGPELDNLKEKAEKMNVLDKVVFAGMVDPDDVWKYYQLGDFFTSASTSETQGLTYIEALSSGLPLLCRKDPCLDDVVEDNVNGCLFTNETEFNKGLDTILSIIGSEAYNRKTISESAEKFSRETFASAVENIYLDMFDEYRRRRNFGENIKARLQRINELTRMRWEKVKDNLKNAYDYSSDYGLEENENESDSDTENKII